MGATEVGVHAALSRQDVERAIVSSGAGTVLTRQTVAGGVGAGLAFVLQGTVVTQQAVQAQSGEDQSCGQQDGGQEPAWSQQMDVRTNVNPHTQLGYRLETYFHVNHIHHLGVSVVFHLLSLCDPIFLHVEITPEL